MLEHTTHLDRLLAAAAGVTLALGMAASAGAMPGLVLDPVRSEAVTSVVPVAVDPVQASVEAPPVAPESAAVAIVPAMDAPPIAATKPAPVAPAINKPPVAAAAKTQAQARPVAAAQAPVAAVTAALPAAAAVPAAAATVARRTPSAAEINSTISELKRQVGGLLRFVSPSSTQINQAGDQACTGFDNGETFAQVKSTGLSMMPSSVDVSEATADWAVRQLVTMYCPGHAGKLA